MIEILLATIEKLKDLFLLLMIFGAVALAFFPAIIESKNQYSSEAVKEKSMFRYWRFLKLYVLMSLFVFLPVLLTPSIHDLWRVRIGLIKYQLASKENIENSAEIIERIGKKLECKYLGCREDKK